MNNIHIIGTAHVSRRSVEEVKRAIDELKPDAVAVELDVRRFLALTSEKREINIVEAIKRGEVTLILFQILLAYFQRKLGEKTGVKPGEEMLVAIEKAREINADVLLIDRDIGITMKRFWQSLNFFEKIKLVLSLFKGMFESVEIDEMVERDVTEMLVREFRKISPKASKVLIDERDAYMAKNLLNASKKYERIVAIVGAGHKSGIEKYLSNPETIPDIREFERIKKGVNFIKIFGFLFSFLILSLFVFIWFYLGSKALLDAFLMWFLINGIFSAFFALIARAHPFSALVAFAVAWLTSINPLIAAGWFSGIAEAWIKKPTHEDVVEIFNAKSIRELLGNRAFKILLVAAMTNVGSMIGTFLALWYISIKFGIDIKAIINQGIMSFLNLI